MKPALLLAACAFSATALAQSDMQQPMQQPSAMNTNAALTRAQVRADLARARTDGTIPRFGNPDPYGPARLARNSPTMYPGR